MRSIRRQYYRFLISFMVILCLVCLGLSYWAIQSSRTVHAQQTFEQIYSIKRAFLKDTVQNLIRDIERIRTIVRGRAVDSMVRIPLLLEGYYAMNPASFTTLSMDLFARKEYQDIIDVYLRDTRSSVDLYLSSSLKGSDPVTMIQQSGQWVDRYFGPYRLMLRINEDWVNIRTKEGVAGIIHGQHFSNGAYIWVNEILDWKGGNDYAIRRVHPNVPHTEGMLLSTQMQDIKGNFPYKTELEGVREYGELFFTYFFKRLESDKIAEKLTYSARYDRFNWIVAMGVYIEDIQEFIDTADEASNALMARVAFIVFSLMIAFFILALFILSRMEKWYLHKASREAREESNTDPLTGALNRRMSDTYLKEYYKRFMQMDDSPAFFFFDLDNFKRVNDTYGHDAGDRVLVSLVEQVTLSSRSQDRLFRWGGEEFLLICQGLDSSGALAFARKLNQTIAGTPVIIGTNEEGPTCPFDLEECAYGECPRADRLLGHCVNRDGQKILHVSISIGISFFDRQDPDGFAVVSRADRAMYQAKQEGKNRSVLLFRENDENGENYGKNGLQV